MALDISKSVDIVEKVWLMQVWSVGGGCEHGPGAGHGQVQAGGGPEPGHGAHHHLPPRAARIHHARRRALLGLGGLDHPGRRLLLLHQPHDHRLQRLRARRQLHLQQLCHILTYKGTFGYLCCCNYSITFSIEVL